MAKQHPILTAIVAGLITLPLLALVFLTNRDVFLLFGILGILCLTLLLFTRPEYGLAALLIVRPLVDSVGDRTISFMSYSINVAAILSLVVIVWGVWLMQEHRQNIRRLPLVWILGAFGALSVISLSYTITPFATVTEILRFGSFFTLFIVALLTITDLPALTRVFSGLAIGIVVPMFVGLIQVATNHGLTFADSVNRAYGTFGHPNVLAFYIVLCIMMLLGWRIARPQSLGTHPLFFVLLAITLILTQTRGAWVGLALGLAVVGFLRFRHLLFTGILITITALLLLPALTGAFGAIGVDLKQAPLIGPIVTREFNTSSYDWRIQVWTDMKSYFFQHPILGSGLGSFPTLKQYKTFDIYDQGIGAHNDYLRLVIELGLIGLMVYVVFLLATLGSIVQTTKLLGRHPLSAIPLFMGGFWVAFVFMSYFDNLLQSTPVMWAFMILLGATLNLKPKIVS